MARLFCVLEPRPRTHGPTLRVTEEAQAHTGPMRCELLLGLAVVTLPSAAQAHSSWLEPPPRTEDYALMEGPCGGIPRGEPTQYTAGQVVQTRWASTQNHFNVYRVSFSPAADVGFEQNIIGSRPDEEDVFDYMQPLTMPMCTCEDCTLQLTQFTATGKLAYYSCADIELVAADGGDPPPCMLAAGESGEGSSTSTSGAGSTSSADDSESSSEADTGAAATSESSGGSAAQETASSSSGGCRMGTSESSGGFALSVGLLWGLRRRRRYPRGQTLRRLLASSQAPPPTP